MPTIISEWIYRPVCGNKTRTMIREDTELKNFPLYCPKCKRETIAMFDGCNSINNLDLSKWNTQNVNNVSWMFSVTFKLTNLKGIENCLCSK